MKKENKINLWKAIFISVLLILNIILFVNITPASILLLILFIAIGGFSNLFLDLIDGRFEKPFVTALNGVLTTSLIIIIILLLRYYSVL